MTRSRDDVTRPTISMMNPTSPNSIPSGVKIIVKKRMAPKNIRKAPPTMSPALMTITNLSVCMQPVFKTFFRSYKRPSTKVVFDRDLCRLTLAEGFVCLLVLTVP